MQIKKTNGEIIPVNADEIADVSFVSAQASVRTLVQQGIQEAAKSLAGRVNFTGMKTLTSINQQLLLAMENTPMFATTVQTMLALAAEANPKAVEEGMTLLRDDGWAKVFKGFTSVEEVVRVTEDADG
jgi:type II secretory ATPase GspE/PulE/Tfp pilus assembly ATPase PilB-like protein